MKNKKNFIFVCFTPYQLLNAVYYSRKITNKNKSILIWHNFTKYNISLSRFQKIFDVICEIPNIYEMPLFKRQLNKCIYGGWMFRFSPVYKVLDKLDLHNSVLVVFSDQHIITNKIIRQYSSAIKETVLIEEGMATYLIKNTTIPKTKDYWINLLLGAHYEPYIGANKSINTLVVKNPEWIPEIKKAGRTIVKQSNCLMDTMWPSVFADVINDAYESNQVFNPKLLWIGQPLETDGVDATKQLELIKEINKKLNYKFDIIIKPHPRENIGKYDNLIQEEKNISIFDLGPNNWIPIEIIIRMIYPSIVMSGYSTAAKNIQDMGIKCKVIYCYKLFSIHLDEQAEKSYLFGTNTYNIDSLDDLVQISQVPYEQTEILDNETYDDICYLEAI